MLFIVPALLWLYSATLTFPFFSLFICVSIYIVMIALFLDGTSRHHVSDPCYIDWNNWNLPRRCIVCCIVSVGQKQQQSNTALFQDQTVALNVRRHCHATVERVLTVIAEIRFILTWNRVCLTNCFHVNVIAVAEHGPVS